MEVQHLTVEELSSEGLFLSRVHFVMWVTQRWCLQNNNSSQFQISALAGHTSVCSRADGPCLCSPYFLPINCKWPVCCHSVFKARHMFVDWFPTFQAASELCWVSDINSELSWYSEIWRLHWVLKQNHYTWLFFKFFSYCEGSYTGAFGFLILLHFSIFFSVVSFLL